MYDELVKALRETDFSDGCPCGAEQLCKDKDCVILQAADAIEELSRDLDSMNEANIALYGALPRWIPVTEGPPLKVGDDGYNGYLVYANGYYEVADYTTDKFDNVPCFHVDGEYEPGVTHFIPLPEPPKEEEA